MKQIKLFSLSLTIMAMAAAIGCTRNTGDTGENSDSKLTHLIINEIFYVGQQYTMDGYDPVTWNKAKDIPQLYRRSQYITITNPTKETKYLDGLGLAFLSLDAGMKIDFAQGDDFREKGLGIQSLALFPSSDDGKKLYPIKPGETKIIAAYAVNHAKVKTESLKKQAKDNGEDYNSYNCKGLEKLLDLSKASFEWTIRDNLYEEDKVFNNPNVPDLSPIQLDESGEPDMKFNEELEESFGVALIELPWSKKEYIDNYKKYKYTDPKRFKRSYSVTSGGSCPLTCLIPFEKVIDCVIVCPKNPTFYQMRPCSEKVDKGYNGVANEKVKDMKDHKLWKNFEGKSLIRKFDGKKIVDTNNSSVDFEVKTATLLKK